MRCGTCGAEVKSELRVCPECGATLRRRGLLHRAMRCRACQARVRAGLSICPYCGAPLRRSWRAPLLTLALLFAVAASAYALWKYVPWQTVRSLPGRVHLPLLAFLATPTPTRTRTPTRVPTRTATPTGTPTHTAVPPTETPPASPTPTAKPPEATRQPAATNTPKLRFAAPRLLQPATQTEVRGGSSQIKLSWESTGTLADDEWYSLSLCYQADGAVHCGGTWIKDTQWIVPAELYTKAGQNERVFQWDVTVMKQTGERPGGGREGAPQSPTSETRTFLWY